MDKWKQLLAQLEVTGGESSYCQEEDFIAFESETNIRFPVGYKEFCQVFGSGALGGYTVVYCPCNIQTRADIREKSFLLAALREELSYEKLMPEQSIPGLSQDKIELLEKILTNAFAFGSNSNAQTFLWDLNTYSETDQSCDIYMISSDYLNDTNLVGRDFYEFIKDFCLTAKSDEILPPKKRFYKREKISKNQTFYRIAEAGAKP